MIPADDSVAPIGDDPTDESSGGTTTPPAAPPPAQPATPAAATTSGRVGGRPVLGAIAGFFLGLFLWIDFVLFGVIAFESVTFWIVPPVVAVFGFALARWTPFRRSPSPTP